MHHPGSLQAALAPCADSLMNFLQVLHASQSPGSQARSFHLREVQTRPGNISWYDPCLQLSYSHGGIYTGRSKLDTCAGKAELKPK